MKELKVNNALETSFHLKRELKAKEYNEMERWKMRDIYIFLLLPGFSSVFSQY